MRPVATHGAALVASSSHAAPILPSKAARLGPGASAGLALDGSVLSRLATLIGPAAAVSQQPPEQQMPVTPFPKRSPSTNDPRTDSESVAADTVDGGYRLDCYPYTFSPLLLFAQVLPAAPRPPLRAAAAP